MAWNEKGDAVTPKGAVGFGVQTLYNVVSTYYAPGDAKLSVDKDMDY
jgi:hypothetical protein